MILINLGWLKHILLPCPQEYITYLAVSQNMICHAYKVLSNGLNKLQTTKWDAQLMHFTFWSWVHWLALPPYSKKVPGSNWNLSVQFASVLSGYYGDMHLIGHFVTSHNMRSMHWNYRSLFLPKLLYSKSLKNSALTLNVATTKIWCCEMKCVIVGSQTIIKFNWELSLKTTQELN